MGRYPELRHFIGGKWRDTPDHIPVLNPATEEEIGRLPHARQSDLEDALAAAENGLRIWRNTAPRTRADTILRAAAILRDRQEEIARAITAEHGKPLAQARLEVIRGAEFFEWDAGEAMRVYGRVIPSAPGTRISVHHHPVGVVAAFSPWNFPMSQPARKIAGALASGCSIILKAAEETPAGAIHIVRAFEEAGLPAGVLNLVFGTPAEISEFLIPQPSVRMVALTGSTQVGRQLTALAAQSDTRVLMELGGHAPVIVCEDTDVERAALSGAVRKMRNAGQVCTSPTRFFVHRSIFDDFAACFTARAAATVVASVCTLSAGAAGACVLLPRSLRLALLPPPRSRACASLDFLDDALGAVPFVVLACQRTGSNALLGYLQRHPQIQMHNELWNERHVFAAGNTLDSSTTARDADPTAFLHAAFRARSDAHRAVGFKLFPEHIRRSDEHHLLFERMLADKRVRKIVLVRSNRLAVCTSMLRASTTGAYTRDNYDKVRVRISPADLQRFVSSYDDYYAWLDELLTGQEVCRLTYEALNAEPALAIAEACAFVGVDASSLAAPNKTCFQRQSTTSLRAAVANFDELREAFAGTDRACDFDE